jgi:hypothetical protein
MADGLPATLEPSARDSLGGSPGAEESLRRVVDLVFIAP